METFSITPDVWTGIVSGLEGGILIGFAAALLIIFNGKIAGISGILCGLLMPNNGEVAWRIVFIAGLVGGGIITPFLINKDLEFSLNASLPVLIIGGFLVGFGTRRGGGCTSGHGICGIGRLSQRSIIATITFMLTAIITVYISHAIRGI